MEPFHSYAPRRPGMGLSIRRWARVFRPRARAALINSPVMTLRTLTAVTTITVGLLAFSPTRPLHSQEPAPAAGQQPPAQNAPAEQPRMINASTDPLLAPLPLPLDRAGEHGRAHRRHRGGRQRSQHHLSRLRGRRRLQVREQRRRRGSRCSTSRRRRRSATSRFIRPTPNIVYVGTGEPNNRQTSSFGDGIYKTTDGGKTWQNIGLRETQTIARIVIDPKNPETVYVAVPGHLFGPNKERGVYKTTDGGRNWNLVKFIDEDTGFTDIAHRSGQHQHRSTPRAISGGAWAAASTAADPAARCGRPRTAAGTGRS